MSKKKRTVIPKSYWEKNPSGKTVEIERPKNPLYEQWKIQRDSIPSVINAKPKVEKSTKVEYEDQEMIERERKAQEEIEAKKLRVGITYNKGAYQFLGNDYDATTLGRK